MAEWTKNEEKNLYSCYANSLNLVIKNNCTSIAFPLISSGLFGYPKELVLKVATRAISDFLKTNEMLIYLVIYDKKAYSISNDLYGSIEDYIDDNYVDKNAASIGQRRAYPQRIERLDARYHDATLLTPQPLDNKANLEDIISKLDESFSQTLLKLIDEKGMDDVDVYIVGIVGEMLEIIKL